MTIVSGGAESNVNFTIRGISDLSGGLGDPDVAVFIDGVYQSNRGAISIGLLDLLRVEVIKGPVSALYGRNAYAGVVNYVTTPPQKQLEGTASVTVGNYGKLIAKASIGGALGSTPCSGGSSWRTTSSTGRSATRSTVTRPAATGRTTSSAA